MKQFSDIEQRRQRIIKLNKARSVPVDIRLWRKTYCKRRHEFTKLNTYFSGNARKCRHCHANRAWKNITGKRYKYAMEQVK